MPTFDEPAQIFLGLFSIKGVGYRTLRDIGGIDEVFRKYMEGGVGAILGKAESDISSDLSDLAIRDAGQRLADQLRKAQVQLIREGDPLYPEKFNDLGVKERPLWFFFKGAIEILAQPAVAVVGTRSPSATGRFLTRYAVSALKELGLPTVSGLAKGIDELAHSWSIDSNLPTISILATGILRSYPASNSTLADSIVDAGGVLLSEYYPESDPSSQSFVWRNRLQAALGKCLIAPEWKASSGTAHTVRFAKRMGRPTINLSVPGQTFYDSGVADHSFILPTENAEFISILKSTAELRGFYVEQPQLFDSAPK